MRFFSVRSLVCVLCVFFSLTAFSQTVPPPALAAKAWALMDYGTGQLLVAHNEGERVEPASLTKLMTAYLVFTAIRNGTVTLDQKVTVSEAAWRQEGSRMFIEPRTPVSVDDLLHGMIVVSGNDASVALAELIAGSEPAFARLMNNEAERLGLKDSHFMNATGLPDPQHYTSAQDLATLAAAVVRDFPEFYTYYSIKSFTYNKITQPNRNRLLWMDSTVDGLKTGHTSSAGFCLTASAKRGDRRLISVVLGTESETVRMQESLKLLNFGFQFFDTVKLYAVDQPLSQFRVWKGRANEVPVGFTHDFIMSLPKGQADKVEVVLESHQPVLAPLQKGQEVGTLKLSLAGKELGQYPVVALEEVPIAGFFGRLWDAIVMWFKNL